MVEEKVLKAPLSFAALTASAMGAGTFAICVIAGDSSAAAEAIAVDATEGLDSVSEDAQISPQVTV